MKESTIKVNDPAGMHARPAGELVKIIKQYPGCSVTLDNGTRKVNAGSILSILSLGLKYGAEATLRAEGENEDAAFEAVNSFFASLK